MTNKTPDYKGFVQHVEDWNTFGISYGLNDLCELAVEYNTPVPRLKLIDTLVSAWRQAENHYLEHGDDCWKHIILEIQEFFNLSEFELKLLQDECKSLGI